MADHTIAPGERATHDHQLAADVLDTVTFGNTPGDDDVHPGLIEILSDGAAKIYVSTDGTEAEIGGAHCWPLPASAISGLILELPSGVEQISLISPGTPTYTVTKQNWL